MAHVRQAARRSTWSRAPETTAAPVGYPARFPIVLAVGATDRPERSARSRTADAELDLSALGCGVEISWPGGGARDGQRHLVLDTRRQRSAGGSSRVPARPRCAPTGRDAACSVTSLGRTSRCGGGVSAAGLAGLVSHGRRTHRHARERGPRRQRSAPCHRTAGRPLVSSGSGRPACDPRVSSRDILSGRSSGVPDFGRAIFRVDGRRYSGDRRAATPASQRAAHVPVVCIEVPDVGRTQR